MGNSSFGDGICANCLLCSREVGILMPSRWSKGCKMPVQRRGINNRVHFNTVKANKVWKKVNLLLNFVFASIMGLLFCVSVASGVDI